jgi:hypothetical protein
MMRDINVEGKGDTDNQGIFLRFRLLSGSNLECKGFSESSPVCVVRILPFELGEVETKTCPACSTPMKNGCTLNSNPYWDFECGFFLESLPNSVLDISVWNGDAPSFGGRTTKWEESIEFQNYSAGCLSIPYIGTVLLDFKAPRPSGRTIRTELYLSVPSPNAPGVYACCTVQGYLRMSITRSAYRRVLFNVKADVCFHIQAPHPHPLRPLTSGDPSRPPHPIHPQAAHHATMRAIGLLIRAAAARGRLQRHGTSPRSPPMPPRPTACSRYHPHHIHLPTHPKST